MILRYIEADLDFGIYALGRWRKSPVMNWWISVYLLWNKGKLQDDIPLLPGYKMVISLSLLIGCFVYLCNKHYENISKCLIANFVDSELVLFSLDPVVIFRKPISLSLSLSLPLSHFSLSLSLSLCLSL